MSAPEIPATVVPEATPEAEAPLSIEDAAGTSEDYPFNEFRDWETYLSALGEAMSTEFATETYPKYIDHGNNYAIVKKFVENGLEPQQALEDVLETAFTTGGRYCAEFENTILNIVRYLIKVKKAELCAGYILGRNYDQDVDVDIQSTVSTRAALLDRFKPKIHESILADYRRVYENPPDEGSYDSEDEDEDYDDSNDDDLFDYALIEESSYLTQLVQRKPKPAPAPAPAPAKIEDN